MATLLLSAAGSALGGAIGGSVLGLSSAVLGQAAGATIGRAIDARILGAGSPAVETGRIDRFRLTGASEGTPVPHVHGRARMSGQVIWSSRFQEQVTQTGGGKGAPSQPTVRAYSYSVSVAIALCAGQISRVGRVWADGNEIAKSDLNIRVYDGAEDQLPDPKIEAVEGTGAAPAYRGTAYVVIEDLDLSRFGNRVPAFSFEVMRSGIGDIADHVQAVALIPGTGEYGLATTPVHFEEAPGRVRSANVHNVAGVADFEASLEALSEELPRCGAASLVVSWFGDDLRCGSCQVAPKVEQDVLDGSVPWSVSGVTRAAAGVVPQEGARPVYGGTPSDASVLEAIAALQDAGQAVLFYPFILMEQMAGNGLPDPWTGADDQPVLPWRGRITSGSTGAQADADVAAFFGTAVASDFSVGSGSVAFTGADGYSYRRFILHYAHLCALAGGVDAFCIGSEMRGLTQIRGASGFPAVDALRDLANEVRSVLGPDVKIGYAADWTEYFGYQPQDGSGDVYFHLDPLWADDQIDFVGIDNYMPMSDWRDGYDHADVDAGSIYDLEYLKSNVAGGEGYDWYYASSQAEAAQIRTPITDGAHNEPWVYRYKDVRGWWANAHHERIGGTRQTAPTDWVPESKPVWFTEIGCAAIDKGTNQPNKFLDPKSSESSLPKHSNGARDDLIQMQYLRALSEYWGDAAHNPVSSVYGAPMVAPDRMYVWAWDARPYPFFPGNTEAWSDGENYARGHWLNGRATARALGTVIQEICALGGVQDVDVSGVHGVVRGFTLDGGETPRSALQPLLLTFGVDAVERDGRLIFHNRDGAVTRALVDAELAQGDGALMAKARSPDAETAGRVRLSYVETDGDYEIRGTESMFPDDTSAVVARSEVSLSLTAGEAKAIVDRWLAEARIARDGVRFALPPSSDVVAGDVVEIDGDSFRVDRIEEAGLRQVDAVRVERALYAGAVLDDAVVQTKPVAVPLPVWPVILDLPLVHEAADPAAPWIGASADNWPGSVAVYSSLDGQSWKSEAELSRRAVMGQSLTPLGAARSGLWDRSPGVEVRLVSGALATVDESAVLAGSNVAAIGGAGAWEVFQFRDAALIGPETWRLSGLLRGQLGTDAAAPAVWEQGATVVVLDTALQQLELGASGRDILRKYRFGPATKPVDHASFVEIEHASLAAGLRPLSPVHLRAAALGGGQFALTWVRRTRIDGDSWVLPDVPLGEAFEAYQLRVLVGDVVLREETVNASNWTYDAAADGVTGPFAVEIAQLSDLYGPGIFARIDIND